MRTFLFHIAAWLLMGSRICFAQMGVYVPPGGSISVHTHDTVAIFSDVKNDGQFGSLKGGVINFYGSKWENSKDAALPDENDYNNSHLQNMGGIFRFLQVKGINAGAQHVYGGYNATAGSGASFPNLSIGNKNNIYLDDLSDLKVRHTLNFETGHLLLNGWNLVVGNGYPGNVTNYSDKGFVVTGTQPGGGFLYREHISTADSMVVFPIGTATGSYSPMALINNSNTPIDIHARTFDSVYQYGMSGNTNATDDVLKTWHIGLNEGILKDVTVWLQHSKEDEGVVFSANRDSSYITRYINGTGWDTLPPAGIINPGMLTVGAPLGNSYMNTRILHDGMEANTYLAVATNNKQKSGVTLFFEAYRETIRWVGTHWKSIKELNLDHYELQRRREEEDSFYTVARIAPHSLNGTSIGALDYNYRDDDLYDNWTYYRLKIFGRDGKIFYSNIRQVPWLIQVTISPNPNYGNFKITIFGIRHKLRMIMHDVAGRERDNRIISGDASISRTDLPAGIYILTFYDTEQSNQEVYTTKVEIIHQ